MKSLKQIFGIGILVITFLFSNQIFSQKRNSGINGNTKNERNFDNSRVQPTHRTNDRYRIQPVRRSPHYRYPRHQRVVRHLPVNYSRIMYGGLAYFYCSGIYYTVYGDEYIVVMPPRGFRITVLPVGHVRIVVGPTVYFYHSGTYYLESDITSSEIEGNYEVTIPPVGIELEYISEDAKEIYVDGIVYYEYNNVLYKEIQNENNKTTFRVIYSSQNNE